MSGMMAWVASRRPAGAGFQSGEQIVVAAAIVIDDHLDGFRSLAFREAFQQGGHIMMKRGDADRDAGRGAAPEDVVVDRFQLA